MKKKILSLITILVLCITACMVPAQETHAIASAVILDCDSVTLTVGQSKTIHMQIRGYNCKADGWRSSDSKIATVTQSGKITAKKAGTANIICNTGYGYTLTCRVKVKALSCKMSLKSATLCVGQKKMLKLIGAPKKPKWTSTNKNIANVSSTGTIKAKKTGKCTIKATLYGKTYKCVVKVYKKNAYVGTFSRTSDNIKQTVEVKSLSGNKIKFRLTKTNMSDGTTEATDWVTTSLNVNEASYETTYLSSGTAASGTIWFYPGKLKLLQTGTSKKIVFTK